MLIGSFNGPSNSGARSVFPRILSFPHLCLWLYFCLRLCIRMSSTHISVPARKSLCTVHLVDCT
jgi:hypothetical protein